MVDLQKHGNKQPRFQGPAVTVYAVGQGHGSAWLWQLALIFNIIYGPCFRGCVEGVAVWLQGKLSGSVLLQAVGLRGCGRLIVSAPSCGPGFTFHVARVAVWLQGEAVRICAVGMGQRGCGAWFISGTFRSLGCSGCL